MTDQTVAAPERPNEKQLNEPVWANNPALGTPVKQMTRGKLKILARSGYVEADPPDWARDEERADPPTTAELHAAQQDTSPAEQPAATQNRPAGRRAAGDTEKEQV